MNILRSSLMEGEHAPTIIRVILATDHASIQPKNSLEFSRFPTNSTFIVSWLNISNAIVRPYVYFNLDSYAYLFSNSECKT